VRRLDLTIRKKIPFAVAACRHGVRYSSWDRYQQQPFKKIVDTINTLNPDIVLLPGDIVDEDIAPVIRQNLGEQLKQIHSKYGIYAVTGNHEYIGGVEAACAYLTEHGIVMLRDTVWLSMMLLLSSGGKMSAGGSLAGIIADVRGITERIRMTMPIISMDHQPMQPD